MVARERWPLLILDLDQTLMIAVPYELGRPADYRWKQFHIYRRPGVEAFLARCLARFDVGVWSSSTRPYVRGVVRGLAPEQHTARLAFVWGQDRCALCRDPATGAVLWRKELRRVCARGARRSDVLVVDDSPEKWPGCEANLAPIAPFLGDPADDELPRLADYLEGLRGPAVARPGGHAGWRGGQAR